MSKRVNRDDIDKFHDYSLYIPSRTVYMGSEMYEEDGSDTGVNGLMAERFIKNMTILNLANQEPITVILNNPGGDVQHGMAIYDAIATSRCHVTVQVVGYAMSMGGIILQAADERIMSPNSRFMMHYGTMGMGVTHTKIFEKWSEENKKTDLEMEQIFMNKILEKHPDFRLKKLRDMLNFDTILNSKEAIALGLADKILGEEE